MAFRQLPDAIERRFWAKVKADPQGCWLWTGASSDFGHGEVRINGKLRRAHQVVWEWVFGPIPDGLCVLHACDVPACVRPNHLFLGTKKDNTQDMMAKGRHKYVTHPGELAGAHKLTAEQIQAIRQRYLTDGGAFGKGAKSGGITQAQLAREYGVSQVQIGNIVRGDQWKVLTNNNLDLLKLEKS